MRKVKDKIIAEIGRLGRQRKFTAEDSLYAAVANFVNMNEWISVEDRLPGNSCMAIVFQDGAMRMVFWDKTEWTLPDYPFGSSPMCNAPTHWMPLPAPPQDKE